MLLAFNKPYGVISQFTADGSSHRALAGFGFPPDVYPLGRLDADSEGLLLLSEEPGLNESNPSLSASNRSEEHTSGLQSHSDLVCRLLLEKKNTSLLAYTKYDTHTAEIQ